MSDTSNNFVQFTNYPITPISGLSNAKITFNSSTYTMSLFGLYSINLTYNWIAGPQKSTFTFELGDACTSALSMPVL